MMFSTKDSLANLRLARHKRPARCQSAAVLPMDELRGLAKKRRRPDDTQVGNLFVPAASISSKKAVTFDFSKNTYRESDVPAEVLKEGWMSGEESEQLKTELRLRILGIQQGLISLENECIRGLESHVDPELTNEKIAKGRNFVSRILNQQTLLRSMMGRANDQILAKLSLLLSKDDGRHASGMGKRDAIDAGMKPMGEKISVPEVKPHVMAPPTGIQPQPPLSVMSIITKKTHIAAQLTKSENQVNTGGDSAMVAFLRARRGGTGSQVDRPMNNQPTPQVVATVPGDSAC